MAIHSTQPGITEIAAVAGYTYSAGKIWINAASSLGSFDAWYGTLPLYIQLDYCAKVRYAQADAMLRARKV